MSRAKWVTSLVAALLLSALGWAYVRYVWHGPSSFSWVRGGVTYELLSPKTLGLLLLVPLFVFFLGRSLADLPWPQRILSLVLRIAFVASLSVALSRVARTAFQDKVCVVYLVDVSDSVPDAALEDAQKEIQRAYDAKPKDALLRIMTFAERPQTVDLPPDTREIPPLTRHVGKSRGAGTDLARALQWAYGLYPAGYLRRAVILSDGVQTDGDVLAESNRAKEFGIRVSTLAYTRPVPGEVSLRELRIPDKLRVGEPFDIHAQIFSSRPQKVKATLKQGEAINGLDGLRTLDLKAGENDITFKSVVRVGGEVTYALALSEPEEDRFPENNHYTAVATVPGRPTILYAEGSPGRANYLSSALSAQQFDVEVRSPRELPTSLREYERYDLLILSDAPAEAVSLTQQDAIEGYVRDLGGGFVFAGGESGYGLGGWYHTTIERILPVRMDAEKRREEPSVAMSLVIDRSGSMSGLPLEMAKQAAKATADTLSGDDLLEVIAFDSEPTRVVRLTPAKHRARIQNDISRIQAGGGTEIFPALDAAYQSLSSVRAKKKHVILLTDGIAPNNGISDLVQAMAAESITVTTVGLGTGIDESLLRRIASLGGGRYLPVTDPQNLPKVFTHEAEMVSRQAAVEEYFQPRVIFPADFLRGVDIAQAPFLHGYVATKMKPVPAQEILSSDINEPILARWHVGLGWSLAWTSDVKNLWSVEWLRWPGYGQFWGQLAREHMRQKKKHELTMRAELDLGSGRVRTVIDAIGQDDRFQNGLDGRFTVTGPVPHGGTKNVPLRQTAPGRYEAEFPLEKFGSYLLKAALEKPAEDGKAKPALVAESFGQVNHPYPREYLALETDKETLSRIAEVTGGTFGVKPEDIYNPHGEKVTYHEELWGKSVLFSFVFLLMDLFLRRVRLFDRKRTLLSKRMV